MHNGALSLYGFGGRTTKAKGVQPLPAKSLKNFNPKMQAFNPVFQLNYGCMGKEGAEWLSNLIFLLASKSMQSVIQMALK